MMLDLGGRAWLVLPVSVCWGGCGRLGSSGGGWLAHCWVLKHQGQMLVMSGLCGVSRVVRGLGVCGFVFLVRPPFALSSPVWGRWGVGGVVV